MGKKNESDGVIKTPSNSKLAAISQAFVFDVPALIAESEDEILEAWSAAEQDASENETACKFKMGFGITLDLEKNKMETKLTFGVRHTKTFDREIPDPNQTRLDLEGGAR